MTEFERELVLVMVDKLFFAAAIALLGFFIARAVEKLKQSLTWNTEVLKQKIELAREVIKRLHGIRSVHEHAAFYAVQGGLPKDLYDQLSNAAKPLDSAIDEARLVLSSDAIDLLKTARHSTFWIIDPNYFDPAPVPTAFIRGESETPHLDATASENLQKARNDVAEAIDKAIFAIQSEARIPQSLPPNK